MGYYANKLREELGLSAEQQTETVETPTETVETPSEQPEQTETASEEVSTDNQESEAPVDGDQTSETDNQHEETKDETKDEPAESTEPPSEKPDLSKISKEEKASHAFQRQLSKMKEKHKAELEEQRESLKKEFQAQFDEFKKSVTEKKEDEPVKTREDFGDGKGGDDAYISYLTQRGVDQRLAEIEKQKAEQQAKEAEQKQREAEEQAQRQQVVDYFNANAKTEFGESYGEFETRLKKGVSNGLAEVLDEAPAVRDFIFSTPDGPLVLNEMLQDRETFVRVMSRGSNPTLAIIECHDLAREIRQKRSAPVETVPRMPRMGKPGVGASTPTAPNIYNDPAAMLDWVHKRRNR